MVVHHGDLAIGNPSITKGIKSFSYGKEGFTSNGWGKLENLEQQQKELQAKADKKGRIDKTEVIRLKKSGVFETNNNHEDGEGEIQWNIIRIPPDYPGLSDSVEVCYERAIRWVFWMGTSSRLYSKRILL